MKTFIAGATGYIGGTVARRLLADGHEVSGLARSEARAAALKEIGIAPIIGTLADTEILREAARSADCVINAANADDPFAAMTLVDALEGTGKRLIHTSGSSIVADKVDGERPGPVITEDNMPPPVPERAGRVAIDRAVLDGSRRGVHSIVICPSLIYGEGRGVNKDSVQVPKLIAASADRGAGVHVGAGKNIWSNVHIDDIADLYALAVERAPAGTFFFAENGEATMRECAAAISRMLGCGGKTVALDPAEAVRLWGSGLALISLASNSRVSAAKARAMLGWTPSGPTLAEEIEAGRGRDA